MDQRPSLKNKIILVIEEYISDKTHCKEYFKIEAIQENYIQTLKTFFYDSKPA